MFAKTKTPQKSGITEKIPKVQAKTDLFFPEKVTYWESN